MTVYKEAHHRSVIKAITYRLLASIATAVIVFFLLSLDVITPMAVQKKLLISLGTGAAEAIAKMFCYYIHERIWSIIPFGKEKHPLSSLPVNKPLRDDDMEIIKNQLKDLGYIDED